jgi:hypothetical protein
VAIFGALSPHPKIPFPAAGLPHLHEEAVDKKGMSRREIKVGVRRVIVNGEARDADRHDRLGPRGATPSKGVPPDPFYWQIPAAHCFDEIANSKILDPCLATRSQDARALEEAVTVTAA